MVAARHVVLPFDGGSARSKTALVRGGKGLGLAEMVALGLPVPPGFTIASGACRAYLQEGRLPNRVHGQIARELASLEKKAGRRFADTEDPLLVSVRSGARVSMPGMMDTVLNVGADSVDGHGRVFGKLYGAIEAVLLSWNSPRAKAYRASQNIPNWEGTAVTIQAMVFGNRDHHSCTGVVFSTNVATGEEGLYGEFLVCAQGEDLVGGTKTPRPIAEFAKWNASLDAQLRAHVDRLAEYYGDIVEVEFTVDSGELFILQVRRAKRSPLATVVGTVRHVWAGKLSKPEALECVAPSSVTQLTRAAFAPAALAEAEKNGRVIATGLAASPGAATGIVVCSSEEACLLADEGHEVILVREDTLPSDLPGMLRAEAIVTSRGGATCHAAVVARELGLPAVVNVSVLPVQGDVVSVDGSSGAVVAGALPLTTPVLSKEANLFLKWLKERQQREAAVDFAAVECKMSANKMLTDCYLLEALAMKAVGSRYEARVAALHRETYARVAGAFAAYLLLAVTGEMRHCWRKTKFGRWGEGNEGVRELERMLSIDSFNQFPGDTSGRMRIHAHVAMIASAFSRQQLVDFVSLVAAAFRDGGWDSGYGGAAWATIAETLCQFLSGEISHTLFVDRVFDLRHNGNVLFNKHPMFAALTEELWLPTQLDIKKAAVSPRELHRITTYGPCSPEVEALWWKVVLAQ
jgi:pyruvate,orthophosphate dikinase